MTFDTKLSAADEKRFIAYLSAMMSKYGNDLSQDLPVYDLRGFWGKYPKDRDAFGQRAIHATDEFKKPGHPTFSNESIYYGAAPQSAGRWMGERFVPPTDPSNILLNNLLGFR